MKNALFGLFMALGAGMSYGQAQAEVQQLGGKEIYLMSEPVASYEIVSSVRTGPKFSSLLTRGIYNEHVNDKATQYVNKSIRRLQKKGIEFDALVYRTGKKIEAVKFTEKSDRLANVQEVNGMHVFVMASPLQAFEVTDQVANGVNLLPFFTYGWFNNSIERDVAKYSKKAAKTENVNAVLYQSGRRASLIKLD
ncbi:MAG: hypothetical protein HRT61_09270 [Ekhidna sp.]|nr:hypothetical protein [Ekhidna sp.]